MVPWIKTQFIPTKLSVVDTIRIICTTINHSKKAAAFVLCNPWADDLHLNHYGWWDGKTVHRHRLVCSRHVHKEHKIWAIFLTSLVSTENPKDSNRKKYDKEPCRVQWQSACIRFEGYHNNPYITHEFEIFRWLQRTTIFPNQTTPTQCTCRSCSTSPNTLHFFTCTSWRIRPWRPAMAR